MTTFDDFLTDCVKDCIEPKSQVRILEYAGTLEAEQAAYIRLLEARLDKARAALRDAEAELEEHEDCDDGQPNWCMSLLEKVRGGLA